MRKSRLVIGNTLVLSLLLSACSGSLPASEQPSSKEQAKNTSNEVVNLQFMGWEASPLETDSVKKGIENFMKKNPNIKVEYTPVPGGTQYVSKLLTMLAGNAAPDVFFLGAREYRSFQERNVLLDLTPQFKLEYKLDEFIPSSAQIMEIKGGIYGVSSCTVSPVLYYNKDVFDKAGLPYPPVDPAKAWTWQQFVDVAKKLTIMDGGKVTQYGAYGFEDFGVVIPEMSSNGGKLFANDGNTMAINTSENKTAFQAILDMRKNDGVAPEAKLLENIGMKPAQMLQSGKIGMLVTGSWALQEIATMKFPVGVAALPQFKKAVTIGQAHVHSAWKNTKHPKEAWKLISYLSSEEYQTDLISSGLWMPNRKSLYTQEGIKKWFNTKVHPEGFIELVPYIRDAEADPRTLISNIKVNAIITEEMDKFWYASQAADVTLKNIESRGNKELATK
ncbi:ABC transporter substrate-binding protein [Paenibacillus agricola]|uniref:Sugar ABC transporter substrate-binding protein n=1 Tax=Paenibacillus agricola TaxID=2716264 RepID=A0ABX0JGR1_9BACL|nr:sugar ABC transporter substrate-binding protein [Paenibacillus agricola]NHN34986.1 sugar ABC transporter substrate-binding protein [Paenibacillus agricola]